MVDLEFGQDRLAQPHALEALDAAQAITDIDSSS